MIIFVQKYRLMKNALFIGGTGRISSAITAALSAMPEWKLFLLNRGNRADAVPDGVTLIKADIFDEADVVAKLDGMQFDCVCDFIGFVPEHVERDWRIFKWKTRQYIYISSASAYHKPCADYRITEGTALANPYWQYSRDKIECEKFLMEKYRTEGFPVTIVRPTHTYDERTVPLGVHGNGGSWQVVKRMMEGKPVIIQGDGTSLWTMTHNSDFAKAFVGLMANVHAIGEAFHITSDETVTWNQVYQSIARVLGVELKACHVSSYFLAAAGKKFDLEGALLGDKANSVVFDLTKLKRAVPDYRPTMRFDEGVRLTIEYLLAHPELQKEDPEFDKWCDDVIAAQEEALARF